MPGNNKPIRLSRDEDRLLRSLYVQLRIPRDQFKKRPQDADFLERAWHNLSGRSDPWQELVRYMQNQQKAKERLIARGEEPWPVFDGNHKRAPALTSMLDDADMEALKSAYEQTVLPLALGTDAVMWNDEVVSSLEREFARLAGKRIPGLILVAVAEEKRKRKLWFRVSKRQDGFDFGSLDDVANGDY